MYALTFRQLPLEIILHIGFSVSPRDIVNYILINARIHRELLERELWWNGLDIDRNILSSSTLSPRDCYRIITYGINLDSELYPQLLLLRHSGYQRRYDCDLTAKYAASAALKIKASYIEASPNFKEPIKCLSVKSGSFYISIEHLMMKILEKNDLASMKLMLDHVPLKYYNGHLLSRSTWYDNKEIIEFILNHELVRDDSNEITIAMSYAFKNKATNSIRLFLDKVKPGLNILCRYDYCYDKLDFVEEIVQYARTSFDDIRPLIDAIFLRAASMSTTKILAWLMDNYPIDLSLDTYRAVRCAYYIDTIELLLKRQRYPRDIMNKLFIRVVRSANIPSIKYLLQYSREHDNLNPAAHANRALRKIWTSYINIDKYKPVIDLLSADPRIAFVGKRPGYANNFRGRIDNCLY